MKIVFFTSNKSKVEWANDLAKKHKLDVRFIQKNIDFSEGRELEVETIAKKKIIEVHQLYKRPFIVEDSGFYIDYLGGFPATHVNFMLKTIGTKGLLKLLEGTKGNNRHFVARSAVGYFDGTKEHVFIGEDVGRVSEVIAGKTDKGWGELMRVIMPLDKDKTFSEFTKREWSDYTRGPHRHDAVARALDHLLTFLGGKSIKPSR